MKITSSFAYFDLYNYELNDMQIHTFATTSFLLASSVELATAFSQLCSALGVFDLSAFSSGILEIRNIDKRVKELVFQLETILECK